jgi:hypothetical protein
VKYNRELRNSEPQDHFSAVTRVDRVS